jgi:hypothetical protein
MAGPERAGRSARAALDFIAERSDLDDRMKLGFCYLVHNCQSFAQDAQEAAGAHSTAWHHSYTMLGIQACKQQDDDHKVYRVRGFTQLPCDKQVRGQPAAASSWPRHARGEWAHPRAGCSTHARRAAHAGQAAPLAPQHRSPPPAPR